MKNNTDYNALFDTWVSRIEVPGKPHEGEVKELMREIGLPIPEELLLKRDDPLPKDPILNVAPPYAVKLCSADVLHKTDVGGVKLDVQPHELTEVLADLRRRFPGEHILITSMVPVRGPELILGALEDPIFGPSVMAGAGGILTELYKDVAFRLAPCSVSEAGRMLDELTIAPVLSGFRGSTMDMKALQEIVSRFSYLAAAACLKGAQLDINPLVWTGSRWLVLDGKAVL